MVYSFNEKATSKAVLIRIVPIANHFVHQDAPRATNNEIILDFIKV